MNKIFAIPFHVTPLENSIMPAEIGGAYVDCFVAADEYTEATKKALAKLASDGLNPKEILNPIQQIEVEAWDRYLQSNWKDYTDHFLKGKDLHDAVQSSVVMYGPFSCYNKDQ